jgi:hypothetical protein
VRGKRKGKRKKKKSETKQKNSFLPPRTSRASPAPPSPPPALHQSGPARTAAHPEKSFPSLSASRRPRAPTNCSSRGRPASPSPSFPLLLAPAPAVPRSSKERSPVGACPGHRLWRARAAASGGRGARTCVEWWRKREREERDEGEVSDGASRFERKFNSIRILQSSHQPAEAVGVQQEHGRRAAAPLEPVQGRRLAAGGDDGER